MLEFYTPYDLWAFRPEFFRNAMMVPSNMQAKPHIEAARRAMLIESEAIARAAQRLDGGLSQAGELIPAHPGKLVVTGLGKSGHAPRKIAPTLCRTGTPAVF